MAEQQKNPVGRPKWIPTQEILIKIENYGSLGMTKLNIARCLGISYETLNEKTKEFAEFSEALKVGEAKGLATVASDLIKNSKKGNVTAQIFYLKCRGKGKWNDDENLRLIDKRIARLERKQKLDVHKDSDHGEQTKKVDPKAISNPGALHKKLHVPEGKKIPQSKLTKALHSNSPKLRKQVTLARTLSGLRKTGGKS